MSMYVSNRYRGSMYFWVYGWICVHVSVCMCVCLYLFVMCMCECVCVYLCVMCVRMGELMEFGFEPFRAHHTSASKHTCVRACVCVCVWCVCVFGVCVWGVCVGARAGGGAHARVCVFARACMHVTAEKELEGIKKKWKCLKKKGSRRGRKRKE